jgi:type I restriction enzyme S subunit
MGAQVSEWREVALEDVAADVTVGHVGPMASEYVDQGIPFLRSQNVEPLRVNDTDLKFITEEFHGRLKKSALSPGDVVIVRTGKPGACAVIPQTLPVANCSDLVVVRCGPLLDCRFLAYFMNSVAVHHVNSHLVGAVQQHFNVGSARSMVMRLPDLPEQRAIAHILGTLDDKIELNRRMNETLEAMARALFKSWFVDFDPVCAKAEGRDPGLPKRLADLFPARLVDSELGEIPEGWEVGSIADFASLNPETWSKNTRPDLINYVDLSNTKWGGIETITPYTQQDAPSRAQRVLCQRDTIVGTVRPGNGSYAFIAEDGLTGSTGFAVLRPRRIEYAEFVYLAATATENIEALAHLADGGAYPAVRPEVVTATRVVRPDDRVLDHFARAARPLLAKMAQNERESRTLAALRDTLLPKLVSGELRVKDAGESQAIQ